MLTAEYAMQSFEFKKYCLYLLFMITLFMIAVSVMSDCQKCKEEGRFSRDYCDQCNEKFKQEAQSFYRGIKSSIRSHKNMQNYAQATELLQKLEQFLEAFDQTTNTPVTSYFQGADEDMSSSELDYYYYQLQYMGFTDCEELQNSAQVFPLLTRAQIHTILILLSKIREQTGIPLNLGQLVFSAAMARVWMVNLHRAIQGRDDLFIRVWLGHYIHVYIMTLSNDPWITSLNIFQYLSYLQKTLFDQAGFIAFGHPDQAIPLHPDMHVAIPAAVQPAVVPNSDDDSAVGDEWDQQDQEREDFYQSFLRNTKKFHLNQTSDSLIQEIKLFLSTDPDAVHLLQIYENESSSGSGLLVTILPFQSSAQGSQYLIVLPVHLLTLVVDSSNLEDVLKLIIQAFNRYKERNNSAWLRQLNGYLRGALERSEDPLHKVEPLCMLVGIVGLGCAAYQAVNEQRIHKESLAVGIAFTAIWIFLMRYNESRK